MIFRWVDPPSGWQYGFPKLWNGEGDVNEWMIGHGYPAEQIEKLGEYFYTRCWHPTQEEIEKYGGIHNDNPCRTN